MSLQDLYRNHIRGEIREKGLRRTSRDVARESFSGFLRRYDNICSTIGVNRGVKVLDEDWDMLVVLDACRSDLMAEVQEDYEYMSEYDKRRSIAGGSLSWMNRNFANEEDTSNLAMVSANPFTQKALNYNNFSVLDEVWKTDWDSDENTVHPKDVTDHAIHIGREYEWDRIVVHYMQPHHPFIGQDLDDGINKEDPMNPEKTVWMKLADGELDYDKVWNGYRQNLRIVLDDLDRLLSNIDADNTIITADHGNGVGEYGVYGHGDFPIDAVRKVPWNKSTASDKMTVEPEVTVSNHAESENVNERLKNLGYK